MIKSIIQAFVNGKWKHNLKPIPKLRVSEGILNILVKRKEEEEAVISDVLYVPSISSNLTSLGQLLDKNYTMKLEI